jgi:hypothetical protein
MNDLEEIDLELEKHVFLVNAKKENPGLYDLIWELSSYDISIEDKYFIAHKILHNVLYEGLVVLEKYSDLSLKNKVETVAIEKIEEILNNPVSWYPDYENYVISLTQKGEKLLEDLDSQSLQKLKKRLFTKSK